MQHLQPYTTIAFSARAGLQLSQLDVILEPKLAMLRERAERAERAALTDVSSTVSGLDAIVLRNLHPGRGKRELIFIFAYEALGHYRPQLRFSDLSYRGKQPSTEQWRLRHEQHRLYSLTRRDAAALSSSCGSNRSYLACDLHIFSGLTPRRESGLIPRRERRRL